MSVQLCLVHIFPMEEHYLESIYYFNNDGRGCRVLDLRSYLQLVQRGYCYEKWMIPVYAISFYRKWFIHSLYGISYNNLKQRLSVIWRYALILIELWSFVQVQVHWVKIGASIIFQYRIKYLNNCLLQFLYCNFISSYFDTFSRAIMYFKLIKNKTLQNHLDQFSILVYIYLLKFIRS